jgi:hypothetical protein
MNEPSDNPNDPEMIRKLEAYVELGGLAKLDSDVIEWLAKHHPDLLKVDEEAIQVEIKRLEEAGVEITPDIIPGITLERIEGPDPSLN